MISHLFGLNDYDASTFQEAKPIRAEKMRWGVGAGERIDSLDNRDSFCLGYMKVNFPLSDEESKLVIPDVHQLKASAENKAVIEKIISYFGNCFLISDINFYHNLSKTIGYDKHQMDEYFKYISDDSNALLIFPLELPIALLVTLPKSGKDTLHQLFVKSNQNARGFLTLHQNIFQGKNDFILVNMIAAPQHNRSDFKDKEYCNICSVLIDGCFHIFKQDLDSETFWSGMREGLSKIVNEDDSLEIDEGRENVNKIIARTIVIEAAVEDKFPELLFCKDDDDKKIRMKVLNQKQREILLDKSNKKRIIKGIHFYPSLKLLESQPSFILVYRV